APYNLPNDWYAVYAEAVDDSGGTSDWDDASIHVVATTPRAVRIAAPRDGSFAAPATVVLVAVTDDLDGDDPVAKVEFLANGALVATAPSANGANGEYAAAWRNVAAGSYAVVARLTDTYGSTV